MSQFDCRLISDITALVDEMKEFERVELMEYRHQIFFVGDQCVRISCKTILCMARHGRLFMTLFAVEMHEKRDGCHCKIAIPQAIEDRSENSASFISLRVDKVDNSTLGVQPNLNQSRTRPIWRLLSELVLKLSILV